MGFLRKKIIFEINDKGCFEVIHPKVSTNHKYPHIHLFKKTITLSRYIWQECFGDIPKRLCVCHKCDNPKCINPEHLFLGTAADNAQDKVKKNRCACLSGEKNGRAKLTSEQVIEIRKLYTPYDRNNGRKALARRFQISLGNLSVIIRGESWVNL